jgi:hypothetical protein
MGKSLFILNPIPHFQHRSSIIVEVKVAKPTPSCSILRITLRVMVANNQNAWGGKGAKKSKKNPKFLIKTAGIEPAFRKDFTTSNVIITEKKDRKAAAFQVKDLPYPYTSVEQFEARFKTPLGSEWNSRAVHQKETMPRVVKKVCPSLLFTFSPLRIYSCPSPLAFAAFILRRLLWG